MGSCAAPSAKGDDKFITTDYLQQCRNGGKNSLNRLIRCVCGKKIGPDPRNFNQRVSLGRN
ncbi:hypothetical protein AUP38_005040, partial [Salmonella enterica subsp. enterica serovar Worthington]|nr:hypothetical protein [Salmonella enterica subsp. enterica serovar Worthington]